MPLQRLNKYPDPVTQVVIYKARWPQRGNHYQEKSQARVSRGGNWEEQSQVPVHSLDNECCSRESEQETNQERWLSLLSRVKHKALTLR